MSIYKIQYTELLGGSIPNIVHKVLRSNTYLTHDKKCKCITKCTDNGDKSWCFVNKSCKGAVKGIRGYWKKCNPNDRFTSHEAKQEIVRVKKEKLQKIHHTNQKKKTNSRI